MIILITCSSTDRRIFASSRQLGPVVSGEVGDLPKLRRQRSKRLSSFRAQLSD